MKATAPFEIIVYRLWKKEMHPEWQCYFENAESLLAKAETSERFNESDFLNFFRDPGIRLSIEDRTAEGRLLRLLVGRMLIVYCNRVWDIELEFEHADGCLKKLIGVEHIATIIRCFLLNYHCEQYFPALGWMFEKQLEEELEEQRSIARSRIFRTNHFIQPIDANAQSVAPLPFDQMFVDR